MNLPRRRSLSAPTVPRERRTPSLFSNEIWFDENDDGSRTFARDVSIVGWSNVGDKLGGAYVGVSSISLLIGMSVPGANEHLRFDSLRLCHTDVSKYYDSHLKAVQRFRRASLCTKARVTRQSSLSGTSLSPQSPSS